MYFTVTKILNNKFKEMFIENTKSLYKHNDRRQTWLKSQHTCYRPQSWHNKPNVKSVSTLVRSNLFSRTQGEKHRGYG